MTNKSDEQILFDKVKIKDYTIVPWSFGVLFEISIMIDEIFTTLEEKNVDISRETNSLISEGVINFSFVAKLFSICAPQLRKIVSTTLNIDEAEVNNMDMNTGIKVTSTIIRQNFDVIKNAVSSSLPELQSLKETEEMGDKKTKKTKKTNKSH